MGKPRTVGVGIDCSPASKAALRWTVKSYLDDGDTVILIHVQPKNADHTGYEDTGSPLVPLEEFRQSDLSKLYGYDYNREVLDVVVDSLRDAKDVKVMAKVYWGDPKKMLCHAVQKLRLSVLVVGCRGEHGGWGWGFLKWFLRGSVTNYVAANATCPVTFVKEQESVVKQSAASRLVRLVFPSE